MYEIYKYYILSALNLVSLHFTLNMLLLHPKCPLGVNPSADNGCELNQRFIVVRMRAVGNIRRWTGKDGFQAARLADENTGWMAGKVWVGDPGISILLSKLSLVPRLVSTTVVETTIWG